MKTTLQVVQYNSPRHGWVNTGLVYSIFTHAQAVAYLRDTTHPDNLGKYRVIEKVYHASLRASTDERA